MFILEESLANTKICKLYPDYFTLVPKHEKFSIRAQKSDINGYRITKDFQTVIIEYSKINYFYKALGILLTSNIEELTKPINGKSDFKELSILIDQSRGGVYKLDFLKDLIVKCALLGYTDIKLNTEFFEIDENIGFGNISKTGQLNKIEIQDLAHFCNLFGIKLSPVIQTLAHLNIAYKHKAFREYFLEDTKDTFDPRKLEKANYQPIRLMIKNLVDAYKIQDQKLLINISCDEAFEIIQKFPDNNAHVFINHVNTVYEICKEYDAECHIWGDFIPNIVKNYKAQSIDKNFPKDLGIIYWDYDHTDTEFFRKDFKNYPVISRVAASTQSHKQILPHSKRAKMNIDSLISAVRNFGKPHEAMLTVWGDDVPEFPLIASLDMIIYFSKVCFQDSDRYYSKIIKKLTGNSLDFYKIISDVNIFHKQNLYPAKKKDVLTPNTMKVILWENPCSPRFTIRNSYDFNKHFEYFLYDLKKYKADTKENKLLYEFLESLFSFLSKKSNLGRLVYSAYKEKNIRKLLRLCREISQITNDLFRLQTAHRNIWLYEKKINGMEVLDQRYENLLNQLNLLNDNLMGFIKNSIKQIEFYEKVQPVLITSFPKRANRTYKEIVYS